MGLIFDHVDLQERFGLKVSGADTWPKPERDRELVHVPGRNGDLIFDNGCWMNVEIRYQFLIQSGWKDKFEEFARWICSKRGYYVLEDPERHPDVYRLAECADSIDPTLWFTTDTGIFELRFNCKPQQFLYSGEAPLQRLVPRTTSVALFSGDFPVNGNSVNIRMIPEIDPSVAGHVNGRVFVYDNQKNLIASSPITALEDGVAFDYAPTVTAPAYWGISLIITTGNSADLDKISAKVISSTIIDGEAVKINAIFARKYGYRNPTGYASKPLMRWRGKGVTCAVNQFDESGAREDWYTFSLSDFSSKSDVAMIDCELQYVYYDYTDADDVRRKGNLGSYLYMTSAESAYGEALSFPAFGACQTEFYTYTGDAQDIALLEIIPRWWRI